MRVRKLIAACGVACVAGHAAHAEVTAFFAVDAQCAPASSVKFSIGKPVNLAVCMTSTREAVCGYSMRLEAANAAESGRFQIKARVLGKHYNDPTTGGIPTGLAVTNPASGPDLGATRDNPLAAAPNQLLATLTLMPMADMKQDTYLLRLAPNSVAGISGAITCADASDAPLNAEVTLRVAVPARK
jgi:hypothetical protein